jgi:hypothetical protein
LGRVGYQEMGFGADGGVRPHRGVSIVAHQNIHFDAQSAHCLVTIVDIARCKRRGEWILWGQTANGKLLPVEPLAIGCARDAHAI